MAVDRQKILRVIAEIRKENENLNRIVLQIDEVKARFKQKIPDDLHIRAMASLLLDFYNSIESIFLTIGQDINGGIPQGTEWHKNLLRDMMIEIPHLRPQVISEGLAEELDEYLRFRHLFIHGYGFNLKWSRIRVLINRTSRVYHKFQKELKGFIKFLEVLVAEI